MLPVTKVIDREDFDDPELLPFLLEVAQDEAIKFGLSEPRIVPDSKQWECAMMLRAFDREGVLRPGALFAGVGAGVEQTTFSLAARGCVVFPTDRYLESTPWSDVAPPGMMLRPEQYSNVKFSRGNVLPVHTDARSLRLPSGFFDGVYSAGSIEHFGSSQAVSAAAEEIGRILKPGGVAAISTEFRIDGPNGVDWFDDNCILFTPEMINRWIVEPSGLELVGSIAPGPSKATNDGRVVLVEFLRKSANVTSLADKQNAYPNLVIYHDGFLFCSVHLTLRKPDAPQGRVRLHSAAFVATADEDARRSTVLLMHALASNANQVAAPASATWTSVSDHWAEAELARVMNSRTMRWTAPVRRLVAFVRGNPALAGPLRSALALYRALGKRHRQ